MTELYSFYNRPSKLARLSAKCGLFLLFITSFNAWFAWKINPLIFVNISIVLFIPYLIKAQPFANLFNRDKLLPIILLIIAKLVTVTSGGFNGYVGNVITLVPIIIVILVDPLFKVELLKFFTRGMALILIPSLFIWVLLLAGASLPNLGTISNDAWDKYVYTNYVFSIRNLPLYSNRFNAIFLEPGHLGMICSFLLYANKFDLKKKSVAVILVAVFFTLSLAAYILVILAFGFYIFVFSRKFMLYFGLFIVVLVGSYLFFSTYKDGANIINERIVSRLEYNDTKGDFSGNNRTSGSLDAYYNRFYDKDDYWFGLGLERYKAQKFGANAGYKIYVIQNGVIGTLLIFLFYLSITYFSISYYSVCFFALYIFAFLQRAYPFWACELLIFITAMPVGTTKNYELKIK